MKYLFDMRKSLNRFGLNNQVNNYPPQNGATSGQMSKVARSLTRNSTLKTDNCPESGHREANGAI